MSLVTQQQIDEFKRDGVLLLGGVFNDWIELLRIGVETNMRDPGPFGREYLDDGQAGRFFGDYCNPVTRWPVKSFPSYSRELKTSNERSQTQVGQLRRSRIW